MDAFVIGTVVVIVLIGGSLWFSSKDSSGGSPGSKDIPVPVREILLNQPFDLPVSEHVRLAGSDLEIELVQIHIKDSAENTAAELRLSDSLGSKTVSLRYNEGTAHGAFTIAVKGFAVPYDSLMPGEPEPQPMVTLVVTPSR